MGPAPQWTDPGVQDASGRIVLTTVSCQVVRASADDIAWISSGLPYMRRLEYGWSKQSPAGMIRITVADLQGVVEAVRAVGVGS